MIRLCEMGTDTVTAYMNTELKYAFVFLFGEPDKSGCFTDDSRIIEFMRRAPYLHRITDSGMVFSSSGLRFDALKFVKKRLEALFYQITDNDYLYTPDEIGEGMLYLVINAFKCWDYDYLRDYPMDEGVCKTSANSDPYYIGFHERTQSERNRILKSELKSLAEGDYDAAVDTLNELKMMPFFTKTDFVKAYRALYFEKLSDPAWYSSELDGEMPDSCRCDPDLIESLREYIPVHNLLFWDMDFEMYLSQIAVGLVPEMNAPDSLGLTDRTEGDALGGQYQAAKVPIDKTWTLKVL